MRPLEIKHRVDTAIDVAVRQGASELQLCLTVVEGTIFAKSLGRDDPPSHYRDVPVQVGWEVENSFLVGNFPEEAARKRWPI